MAEQSDKHRPFFHKSNSKRFRKTGQDLVINFGANNPLNKTLKDVRTRSVTVEVDASGQPIFEVFEFIAKDVEESDNEVLET